MVRRELSMKDGLLIVRGGSVEATCLPRPLLCARAAPWQGCMWGANSLLLAQEKGLAFEKRSDTVWLWKESVGNNSWGSLPGMWFLVKMTILWDKTLRWSVESHSQLNVWWKYLCFQVKAWNAWKLVCATCFSILCKLTLQVLKYHLPKDLQDSFQKMDF